MPEHFVHDRGVRVIVNGIDATFHPGVPRPLRPLLHEAAFALGVRPVGESVAPAAPATEPPAEAPSLEQIRDALVAIMARGNKADVTRAGNVRMEALEAELNYNVSTADRDAAMALIPAGE